LLSASVFQQAPASEAYEAQARSRPAPQAVPDAIFILAAAVWLVLVAGYAAQELRRGRADLGM